MKKLLTLLLMFSVFSIHSFSQATRTWVSGVGDDVNPCSRTAPCKTFAGAISKTAVGGEINVLDAGGYGAVTITKSITIDGGGAFASILASGVNGIIINAPGAIVNIRNLNINGTGSTLGANGIRVLDAKQVHIENTTLLNFADKGIDISPLNPATIGINNVTIHNTHEGISIANGASQVTIHESRIQSNNFGIHVKAGRTTISNSLISDCNTGIATMKDGSATLTGNIITQNNIAFTGIGKFSSVGNNSIIGNKTQGTATLIKTQ